VLSSACSHNHDTQKYLPEQIVWLYTLSNLCNTIRLIRDCVAILSITTKNFLDMFAVESV